MPKRMSIEEVEAEQNIAPPTTSKPSGKKRMSIEEVEAESNPEQEVENPHDLIPFLKQTGKGALNLGKDVIIGGAKAVMSPIKTASDIGDSLSNIDGEGIYRTIRNVPILGSSIDSIVSSGKGMAAAAEGGMDAGIAAQKKYKQDQMNSDAIHARDHPVTDFIQRGIGSLPFLPQQVPLLAADAVKRSLDNGTGFVDSLKDGRNALVLGTGITGLGNKAAAGLRGLGSKFPEKVGVSPEAQALYRGLKKGDLDTGAVGKQEGPIRNFPSKDQLKQALEGSTPSSGPSASQLETLKQFEPGQNQGTYFKDLGTKAGTAAGGGIGGFFGHYKGAAAGAAIGNIAGKAMGKLVDTYGPAAVKTALDAGIALEKIMDTPYIGPIMQAAAKGSPSLSVTTYLLNQKDPKYRQIMNSPTMEEMEK